MGWASAGSIFDRVAQGLVDGKVDPEIGKPVLVDLIGALRDMDWDTTYESRDAFLKHSWIEDAFFEADGGDDDLDQCEAFVADTFHRGRIKTCENCGWSKRIHDRQALAAREQM